jgi:aspartate/methionine/tyrosine aminotransferase
MFSSRVPSDLAPNRLARAVASARRRSDRFIDLTETNPTKVGISYPDDLLAPLADPAALAYEPEPFGLPHARRAVADVYERLGLPAQAERVVLTASTSEAYAYLFKLLCEPGDEVLVPVPSYPLFEHLTRLESVITRTYPLEYHGLWAIDFDALTAAIGPRTRAILVVSPNNPTGSMLGREELDRLAAICAERSLALIGDEVFLDYRLRPRTDAASVLEQDQALTFGLGGLSKSTGLPQLKLGWIVVAGPAPLAEQALARLEIIADSFLSVGTPVQQAAGKLLARGREVRERIVARVTENLSQLEQIAIEWPVCSPFRVEGGWSAVVRVPAWRTEESLVIDLVEQEGVLVHPGFFFDFPREAYLVFSLLPEVTAFREGASRALRFACQRPTAAPTAG